MPVAFVVWYPSEPLYPGCGLTSPIQWGKWYLNNHILNTKSRLARVNLIRFIVEDLNKSVTFNFYFLPQYKKLNELIWQDGFLIDFLQKKVVDRWIRGFVIFTANLFSESLMFDNVVRFFITFVLQPAYNLSIYETLAPAQLISTVIYLYSFFFVLLSLFGYFLYIG